jgi:hypothetical protein
MQQNSWEGTILAFAITFTILLGVIYILGAMYRIVVPWPLIPLISLAVAFGLRYRRR